MMQRQESERDDGRGQISFTAVYGRDLHEPAAWKALVDQWRSERAERFATWMREGTP
jgi:hypothetical protein